MDIKKSVTVTRDGYIDRLGRGATSGWVRVVADRHIAALRERLTMLASSRGKDRVAAVIETAALPGPIARREIQGEEMLSGAELRAADELWLECQAAGLSPRELVKLLSSGVGA